MRGGKTKGDGGRGGGAVGLRFSERVFAWARSMRERPFSRGDVVVLAGIGTLIYAGIRLAVGAPAVVQGPQISLSPAVLPWYTAYSVRRMFLAYLLSLAFTLLYGYAAAYNRRAAAVLLPLLDVLQSVPILSFLPVVLLSLSAILPERTAVELAAVILIFTSQAWNLTFAWYQSLTTIPVELREASSTFRLNTWLRLNHMELPFAAISLIWNSVMSWAGGWFFLMAAEMFTVGQRDFRLPGLGAYLQQAAVSGDGPALVWGLATLVLVIVGLDQLVWRPLLAWSDRFKVEMTEADDPPTSWFYNALQSSRLVAWLGRRLVHPAYEWFDARVIQRWPPDDKGVSRGEAAGPRPDVESWRQAGGESGPHSAPRHAHRRSAASLAGSVLLVTIVAMAVYGGIQAAAMLTAIPARQWGAILVGVLFTFLRVAAALAIALLWTVPVGVAIGTNRRLAILLQPLVQIAASVPATALFPVLLLALANRRGGLDAAAILLMLMGTQWYLLFNIIAGAASIPQDLKYTSRLLQLGRWQTWRRLILPSLVPYLITGSITAGGGAWNASIVAEHASFAGQVRSTIGIGAVIADATARGDYPLLLASTLSMILAVVLINRFFWRRLYAEAAERYRME